MLYKFVERSEAYWCENLHYLCYMYASFIVKTAYTNGGGNRKPERKPENEKCVDFKKYMMKS